MSSGVDELDREIEELEAKLRVSDQKQFRKLQRKLVDDGFDEDLYQFLDQTIQKVKEKPVKRQREEVVKKKKKRRKVVEQVEEHQIVEQPQQDDQQDIIAKQVKAIMNRITDQNIDPLNTQLLQLFRENSSNQLNEIIWEFLEIQLGQDFLPEQIIAVYAAEITALGRCIGLEILAYFTDKMYKKLDKKNFVKIFCYLYIFKALNSDLIFGLINQLSNNLNQENEIELLQVVWNLTGFKLRRDDPARLKQAIDKIKQLASQQQAQNKRVEFMLETLANIRNNKKQLSCPEERLQFLKTWISQTLKQKTKNKE